MKKFRIMISCGALFMCSFAQAAHYGMAGCGLGSLIFEDKPGKIQILSSLTNTYFAQTSAITTGTSNCTDMPGREQAMLYINVNQKPLAKDVSRGSGETLVGLAAVLGCSDSAKLASALQKNYRSIFSVQQSNSETVGLSIENTIKNDAKLKENCALFS